jgi:hypothetical protein
MLEIGTLRLHGFSGKLPASIWKREKEQGKS